MRSKLKKVVHRLEKKRNKTRHLQLMSQLSNWTKMLRSKMREVKSLPRKRSPVMMNVRPKSCSKMT